MKMIEEDKLYFMDFETGGLKPHVHAVCSYNIRKYHSSFSETLKFYPQKAIYEYGAFKVNNLEMKQLFDSGVTRDKLINTISNLFEAQKNKQGYLIISGWNIGFDMDFLNFIYRQKGVKLPCPVLTLDLMEIAKQHLDKKSIRKPQGVENFKLTTIYSYYFSDLDENKTHTADYDTYMCEQLYNKFKELKFL